MKKFLLCGVIFSFLFGCNREVVETPPTEIMPSRSVVPHYLVLNDQQGNLVGKSAPLGGDLFVSPDHLLQKYDQLFDGEKEKIKILVRDFENDLLVFRLPMQEWESVQLSTNPPAVGKTVFWFDGEKIRKTNVLGIKESFLAEDRSNKNLIAIEGIAHLGDSGSLVFDEKGLVYGMIIGSDKSKNQTYAIRSDKLLEFLEENVEE